MYICQDKKLLLSPLQSTIKTTELDEPSFQDFMIPILETFPCEYKQLVFSHYCISNNVMWSSQLNVQRDKDALRTYR